LPTLAEKAVLFIQVWKPCGLRAPNRTAVPGEKIPPPGWYQTLTAVISPGAEALPVLLILTVFKRSAPVAETAAW